MPADQDVLIKAIIEFRGLLTSMDESLKSLVDTADYFRRRMEMADDMQRRSREGFDRTRNPR